MPVKLVSYHGLTFICLLFTFYFNQVFTFFDVFKEEAFINAEILVGLEDAILSDTIVFSDCVLSNDTFPDINSGDGVYQIIEILHQAEINSVEKIEATGACVKKISTGFMDCTGVLNGSLEGLNEVFGPDFITGDFSLEFESEILAFTNLFNHWDPTPRWQLMGLVKIGNIFLGIPSETLHVLVVTARDSSGQSQTGLQFFEVEDQMPPIMKCQDDGELLIKNEFDEGDQDGIAYLTASTINDGSWDNCNLLSLKIKIENPSDSSTSWQDSLSYSCADIGETLSVILQGTDKAGNTNTCTRTVKIAAEEIIGSPLVGACQKRLSVQLSEDANNEYLARVNATDFISITACAASSYPADVFSIYLDDELQGPINDSTLPQASIQLSCDQLDGWFTRDVPLRLTFKDSSGEIEQCKTYISLSGEQASCSLGQGTLKGAIRDIRHQALANIEVGLSGWLDTLLATDDSGIFQLPLNDRIFNTVKIQAFKDDDHNQDISTLDIIRIARHILGTDAITSPYLLIAADVNASASITTFDLIQLRKLILGTSTNFPNNRSWRFIPADYQFRNPKSPWQEFSEEINITQREVSQRLDFIGIKIGDIENAGVIEARAMDVPVLMNVREEYLLAGKKYALTLEVPQLRMSGIQFSIDFNNALLENISYQQIPAEHVFWNKERNQLNVASNGLIDGELLTLELTVSQPQFLSETIKLNERLVTAEVYTENLEVAPLQLQFEGIPESISTFELFQNVPNPFRTQTSIPFFIPNPGEVQLKIFDANGRTLIQRRQTFPQGKHYFDLNFETEMPAGIYTYAIQFKNQVIRRRLIIG